MEPSPPGPLRNAFYDELDQIRLQVELMGVRVDQNLERMRDVLRTGDTNLAATALAADDEIDNSGMPPQHADIERERRAIHSHRCRVHNERSASHGLIDRLDRSSRRKAAT